MNRLPAEGIALVNVVCRRCGLEVSRIAFGPADGARVTCPGCGESVAVAWSDGEATGEVADG